MVKTLVFDTIEQRNNFIVSQRQDGVPASDIAEELRISRRTVERVYTTYKTTRRTKRKRGSGRPKALTKSMKNKIISLLKRDPYLTCGDIAERFDNEVSDETIRQYLKSKQYSYKKPSRVPYLTQDHITLRVDFAENYQDYDFQTTFFTDECTFDLNGSVKGWSRKGKRIPKNNYVYAPKVQVWGAISCHGDCYLETYHGSMNAKNYKEMLKERFIPFAEETMEEEWTLIQDGASSHTANKVMEMLDDYDIHVPRWPAKSPDINPIENVWGILKSRVYRRCPKNVQELEDMIFEEWDAMDSDMIGEIASSINSRLQQVIDSNGLIIDY